MGHEFQEMQLTRLRAKEVSVSGQDLALGAIPLFRSSHVKTFVGRDRSVPARPLPPNENQLRDFAAQIHAARQARSKFIPPELLGEAAWDIMLALYCDRVDRPTLSVSKLAFVAGVPPTSALRWSQALENHGLIERTADKNDGRRIFVSLTAEGRDRTERALSDSWMRINKGSCTGHPTEVFPNNVQNGIISILK